MRTLATAVLLASIAATCPAQATATMTPQDPVTTTAKAMPSPPAAASANIGGTVVNIKYNAPAMRGRKIIGGLVPYGEVWRTGANPATSFVTAGPLKIGTLDIPAGAYTLYTLPAAPGTPWQLIINKQTGQWGTEYHEEKDLGRTPLMSKTLSSPQESMSITLENVQGKTAELHIRWESTDEYIKIVAK